ncbi:MAG: hypothetical protein ABSH41_14710 [Syntrophobacteraceae bacterium]
MSDINDKDSPLHLYSIDYTRRWENTNTPKLRGARTKRGKPIAESKTVLARDEERAKDIVKKFARKQRFDQKSPLELGKTYTVVVNITTIKEIY